MADHAHTLGTSCPADGCRWPAVEPTASVVLTNHRMVRDGSFWRCMNACGTVVPFPSPMPRLEADCVPRRWTVDESN